MGKEGVGKKGKKGREGGKAMKRRIKRWVRRSWFGRRESWVGTYYLR